MTPSDSGILPEASHPGYGPIPTSQSAGTSSRNPPPSVSWHSDRGYSISPPLWRLGGTRECRPAASSVFPSNTHARLLPLFLVVWHWKHCITNLPTSVIEQRARGVRSSCTLLLCNVAYGTVKGGDNEAASIRHLCLRREVSRCDNVESSSGCWVRAHLPSTTLRVCVRLRSDKSMLRVHLGPDMQDAKLNCLNTAAIDSSRCMFASYLIARHGPQSKFWATHLKYSMYSLAEYIPRPRLLQLKSMLMQLQVSSRWTDLVGTTLVAWSRTKCRDVLPYSQLRSWRHSVTTRRIDDCAWFFAGAKLIIASGTWLAVLLRSNVMSVRETLARVATTRLKASHSSLLIFAKVSMPEGKTTRLDVPYADKHPSLCRASVRYLSRNTVRTIVPRTDHS